MHVTIEDFFTSHKLTGTFGVVKLWPKMQVAEDEVIARLKVAAEKIGAKCVEITPDGKYLKKDYYPARGELDFVIHLHFETPKAYDHHSFVALWNPLEFYYIMRPGIGYRPYSENLITHEDFLSCGSKQADDHVRRQLVKYGEEDRAPELTMFHSLAEPILPPSLGDQKIFYVGINWERVGGRKSRHQDILNMLDESGNLLIYGPERLNGIKVWDGFKHYIGSIPFDGSSVIERIAEAGIVLVLSSDAHKDAEMMSNRLFEGLAAGAVIIVDENPFARHHFGDTLLYIDTTQSPKRVVLDIMKHMQWIKQNPADALALAKSAQDIFKARFTMDRSLEAIYRALPERMEARKPHLSATPNVRGFFLLPTFDETLAEQQIDNAKTQNYPDLDCVFVIGERWKDSKQAALQELLKKHSLKAEIQTASFFKPSATKGAKPHLLGRVINELYQSQPEGQRMIFVEAVERLFSDHVTRLVAAMETKPEATCAYTSMVISKDRKEHDPMLNVSNEVSILTRNLELPLGTGRYLVRKTADGSKVDCLLPYLTVKFMAAFLMSENVFSRHVTMVRHLGEPPEADTLLLENEVLMDAMPASLIHTVESHTPQTNAPDSLSLHNLSRGNKLQIVRDLFEELPIPTLMKKFILFVYHSFARRR